MRKTYRQMGMLIAEKLLISMDKAERKRFFDARELQQSKLPKHKQFQANLTPQQKAKENREVAVANAQAGKQI